ncbi:N-formylglutamate amidohydrolase [Leucobacter sp. 1207-22]|uniref:N-formylglutamate amidohydrolase n=1 Tax=Leucobacter sp. 1207-22 TaxID=2604456 RepID=UPI004063CC09
MTAEQLDLIPAGTVFTPDDLTFYANSEQRSLAEAIRDADVLVSCPHSGARIPAEVAPFLAPNLTRRLQYDFTDMATSAICRRWAEIDPRIIYVENPHPRLIRDPNRAKPADPGAKLREAIARVRAAGAWQKVDLTGVDAIRPVTFSFYPVLVVPETDAELDHLVSTFTSVAGAGLEVYERTRDELTERMLAEKLKTGGSLTRLSFHDTMNTTTTRDGAVNVPRAEADRLPNVVSLSNRGDGFGEERTADDPIVMDAGRIRSLAAAHREAFDVADPADVALNKPYLGSQEIIAAGARFRAAAADADAAGLVLSAVQAEFLREFLLGEAAVRELHEPGERWITEDPARIEQIAQACKQAWDLYRGSAPR